MQLHGHLINILEKKITYGTITIEQGIIIAIDYLPAETAPTNAPYLLPGFVDAHVHIESSMLTPVQFARLAVVHGTVGTVSDPHEIGNVLGMHGVQYMVENARQTPLKICFGAPSCVPATTFETAGAAITPAEIADLFQYFPEIGYLAEVMNFPGVLAGDADMLAKIAVAKTFNKPIDGHAPGLRGEDARRYAAAGPQTDHESFTAEEALDKLACGMKILIREGSAAKNFEALIDLLPEYYANMMFCSDDKHPDSLVEGHINLLVKRALNRGQNLFEVLQVACVNPVLHYQLPIGLLRKGDPADLLVVNNLQDFTITQTYLDGVLVAENGRTLLPDKPSEIANQFNCKPRKPQDFRVLYNNQPQIKVIEAIDGQLITLKKMIEPTVENGSLVSDVTRDILKMVVVNRYYEAPVAVAFIKNFGLKTGAIASSVAHDSHNIIAVGTNDNALCEAINLVIQAQGGVSAVGNEDKHLLPLPIAGLMSGEDGYEVAQQYAHLDQFAKQTLGSTLQSPFMTLSFMALLVIPQLKLSDKGLFDGEVFDFVDL